MTKASTVFDRIEQRLRILYQRKVELGTQGSDPTALLQLGEVNSEIDDLWAELRRLACIT